MKKPAFDGSVADGLRKKVEAFPRLPLIQAPTPLHRLEKLSAGLGGPDIWMKRDDLTGLAFGGNKSRKLEFILSDVLAEGADTIVTWGSLQSNWCLQTAAAARKMGLRTVLVLFKTSDLEDEADGNLFLDRLAGAEVRLVEAAQGKIIALEKALAQVEAAADEVRARGGRPYLIPVGGSLPGGSMTRPLGALAYVRAFVELAEQARDRNLDFGAVVHATGSGGTQAGLLVGAKALGLDVRVFGISVSDEKESFSRLVLDISRMTADALELEVRVEPEDVVVLDDYLVPGYGYVDERLVRTLTETFRAEAVLLDPVYTAKAMVGLEDLARRGFLPRNRSTVFYHTGGTPALFPYRRKILDLAREGRS